MTQSIAQQLMDKWEGNPSSLREEYREKLKHGTWIVEFTKADGTPSTMECTLDPTFLPPPNPNGRGERTDLEHLLHVFSVDRNGWRSFIVANVKNFYRKPEAL